MIRLPYNTIDKLVADFEHSLCILSPFPINNVINASVLKETNVAKPNEYYVINNNTYYLLGISWDANCYIFYADIADYRCIYTVNFQYTPNELLDTNSVRRNLIYVCSVKNNEPFIYNYRAYHIEKDFNRPLTSATGQTNLPYLAAIVSNEVSPNYKSTLVKKNTTHKVFDSTFGHEVLWSNIIYPVHLINASSINLTLLNSVINAALLNNINEDLPQVILSNDNKLLVLTDGYRTETLYLGGKPTLYVEDQNALEQLKYILLRYIYSNSHITKKYNFISFSINHQKKALERVRIRKIKGEVSSNEHKFYKYTLNLGCTFSSLKVSPSSKLNHLEDDLVKWLTKNSLFTDQLGVSNYIVEVKDDFLIKVANYLTGNLMVYTSLNN